MDVEMLFSISMMMVISYSDDENDDIDDVDFLVHTIF